MERETALSEEKRELSMIQSRPAGLVSRCFERTQMQIHCLMRTDGFHMDLHTQLRFSSRMELSGVSESFVRLYDAIIVPLRVINSVVMIITACKRYTYICTIYFYQPRGLSIARINSFYGGASRVCFTLLSAISIENAAAKSVARH